MEILKQQLNDGLWEAYHNNKKEVSFDISGYDEEQVFSMCENQRIVDVDRDKPYTFDIKGATLTYNLTDTIRIKNKKDIRLAEEHKKESYILTFVAMSALVLFISFVYNNSSQNINLKSTIDMIKSDYLLMER